MPQPKPSSCGRRSQPTPVCSTNKILAARADHQTACDPGSGSAAPASAAVARSAPTTHPTHSTAWPASTPSELDDRCRRIRYRRTGPFIQLELLMHRRPLADELADVPRELPRLPDGHLVDGRSPAPRPSCREDPAPEVQRHARPPSCGVQLATTSPRGCSSRSRMRARKRAAPAP